MEDSFRQTRISGSDLSACLQAWGRHWTAEGAWPPDNGNGQALSWPPQLTSHEPRSVCACRQAGPRPGLYGSAHFCWGGGGHQPWLWLPPAFASELPVVHGPSCFPPPLAAPALCENPRSWQSQERRLPAAPRPAARWEL